MTISLVQKRTIEVSGAGALPGQVLDFTPLIDPLPPAGDLVVVVISVSGDNLVGPFPVFERPEVDETASIEDGNAFFGWGRAEIGSAGADNDQSSYTFWSNGTSFDGYYRFPSEHPANAATVITATLIQLHSDLGPVFGFTQNSYDVVSLFDPPTSYMVEADPWVAAMTGYAKPGMSVGFFVPNYVDQAKLNVAVPGHNEETVPGNGRLLWGERNLGTSAFFNMTPGGGEPTLRGNEWAWTLTAVVVQTGYSDRQQVQATGPSVELPQPPVEDNALVATCASPGELPSVPGWETISAPGEGITATLLWRPVGPNEGQTLSFPGATHVNVREVQGFAHGPRRSVWGSYQGVATNVNLDEDTVRPVGTLAGNDGYFYAAVAFADAAPEGVFLLPEFIPRMNPPQLVTSGDGWDFYPDGEMPVFMTGAWSAPAPYASVGIILTDDIDYTPPVEPPSQVRTSLAACPKSVRACALRLTRMNGSAIPIDPLTPEARIQTSAFAKLSLSPDRDTGKETVTTGGTDTVALIDRACNVTKGMDVQLQLCGVPYSVLEMLTQVAPFLDDRGYVTGAALRDGFSTECVNLVMVELWSKNKGAICDENGEVVSGRWIQWLLPLSMRWELTSDLDFEEGALDVQLSGYATQNPSFYPSLPGPTFNRYLPGGGDPSGWPTGPAGAVLPPGIEPDTWTLADQAVIRAGGALAWKVVDALPFPLDDCDYLDVGEECEPGEVEDDFCGAAGPLGPDWTTFNPLSAEV